MGRPERQLHARGGCVRFFAEGHLDDSIVVDSEGFADRILCNLEPPIDIAPKSRLEIKTQVEHQGKAVQGFEEWAPPRKREQNFLSNPRFKPTA